MSETATPGSPSGLQQLPPPTAELSELQKKNPKYYYWHTHGKERAKEGDVAPMPTPQLVKTEALAEVKDASPKIKTTAITKYSWCNNNKSVSVYVDFPGVEELKKADETALTVDFSKKNLHIKVMKNDVCNVLSLRLKKETDPETSSFRLKPDQIVLKLMKPEGNTDTWFDLVDDKAAKSDDDE